VKAAIVAMLSVACSESPARDDADRGDAADATIDAGSRCDVTKPFGAPVLVQGVNTPDDDRPGWLSGDGLTLYFARAPAGSTAFDLYVATRTDRASAFSSAAVLSTSTVLSEKRPVLTADELTLFIEFTNSASDADIGVATRPSVNAEFGPYVPLAVIDTAKSEFNPWISGDELALYFTSDRDGFNDVLVARRAVASDPFGMPSVVDELSTVYGDYMGALRGDGLEIFFASSRDTNLANGDIFHATRTSPNDPFDAPTKLGELSDPATNEAPTWISADGCELLFTSDRAGASYDVWTAKRPAPMP
jgi:hypothetical protein